MKDRSRLFRHYKSTGSCYSALCLNSMIDDSIVNRTRQLLAHRADGLPDLLPVKGRP